jgi:two-component system, NtrC family, sensor kinase
MKFSFNPRLKFTLQTRILLFTLLVTTSVLWVSDKFSTLSSVKALEDEIGSRTTMAAQRLASDLRRADLEDLDQHFRRSLSLIREWVPNITRVDVHVYENHQLNLLVTNSLPAERLPEDFEVNAFKSGKADTYIVDEGEGQSRIMAVKPVALLGGKPGLVTVTSSLKPVDDLQLIHSRIQIYKLGSSIIVLVLGITLMFRSTVYRSVHHLVSIMQRFRDGNIQIRALERLPGEFGDLARHLNQMLDEISQFSENMKLQIRAATETLAWRNQELEKVNLLLIDTQKRLTQSERLALIGQWTATFAHEIGSPLSAVSTHLQILLEDAGLQPGMRERLRLADAEINRVCSIVENLLAEVRRPDARSKVNLCDLIHKVAHLLGPTFQTRQLHFNLNCQGPAMVMGNPDQLQQIFLNLFSNAQDASAPGGTLRVKIERGSSPEPDGRIYWQVDVSDSGSGISEDKLGKIFEPFFTTKEFKKGAGLGLAVCQEIIRQHNGRMTVESQPNRGTTFSLWIPAAESGDSNESKELTHLS